MNKNLKQILIIIIFLLTVFLGGGKTIFNFSVICIFLFLIFLFLILTEDKIIIGKNIYKIIKIVCLMLLWFFISGLNSKNFISCFINIFKLCTYLIFFIITYLYLRKTGKNSIDSIISCDVKNNIFFVLSFLNVLQSLIVIFQKILCKATYGLFPVNPNLAGSFIACITIYELGLIFEYLKYTKKFNLFFLIKSVSFITGLISIFIILSRGVLLIFFVIAGFLIVKNFKMKGLIYYLLVLSVFIFIFRNKLTDITKINDPDAFYRPRIWYSSIKIFMDNSNYIYGVGPGNFGNNFPRFNFPLNTNLVRYTKYTEFSHNEYLQILVETGLPGFILLVYLIYFIFKKIKLKVSVYGGIFVLLIIGFFDINLHLPANIFLLIVLLNIDTVYEDYYITVNKNFKNIIAVFGFLLLLFYLIVIFLPLKFPTNKNNYMYHFNKAIFYLKHSKEEEKYIINTIKEFQQTIQINPYHALSYFYLGRIYYNTLKDFEMGKKYFMKAITIEPNFVRCYYYINNKKYTILKEKFKNIKLESDYENEIIRTDI